MLRKKSNHNNRVQLCRDKPKIHLFLLHHILTGNFISVLFEELRVKRGLCYGVDSDNILIKYDESEAIKTFISKLNKNDVLIIFSETDTSALDILLKIIN